ncbi:MAG: histidine phosphatase family protein [Ruthenibacterium sp.]
MKNYRLYLVRHAITQGNLDGIYVGSGTDEMLCDAGREQLRSLQAQFTYPDVKTVFSSPLKRAVETAEILFPAAQQKLILQDLRENAFGEFEGRPVKELVHEESFKKWIDPAAHFTPQGGESAHDFHARCRDVLMKILEAMMKSGIEEAACITHGGVIMSMLAQRGMPKYPPEHWMADSGCGYVLQCNPAQWMRDGIAEVTDILPFGYMDGAAK